MSALREGADMGHTRAAPRRARRGRGRSAVVAMACAVALAGCAGFPTEAERVTLQPDSGRAGSDGDPGPHGVGCAEVRVQARVSDAFDATVCWPGDDAGALAAGGPFEPVVVLQGGLVARERYQWLLTHLASRGYVVAAPAHPGSLAILAAGNAEATRAWLQAANAAAGLLQGAMHTPNGVGILGHSLGSTVATQAWLDDEGFGPLVLLGGYPADGDDVSARAGDPVLSVSGQRDGYATPGEVRAGFDRFEKPRWLGLVSGMHHFAWADAATPGELETDGTPARPVVDLRRDAMRLVDAFLDTHVRGDADGYKRLNAGAFPGVELSQ